MKILHRISLNASEADWLDINRLEIKVPALGSVPLGFVAFDVSESDESWPAIEAWIARRHPGDIVRTVFSTLEVAEAKWLNMEGWQQGYPQPEDEWVETTYDIAQYCPSCGVGKVQKGPFRMAGEPHWGKRAIAQLNLVWDEFFVTPESVQAFTPYGIASRPVVNARGAEVRKAVQLVVEERVSVANDGLSFSTCDECRRVKFQPIRRGPLPPLLREPVGHIARTEEWFGGGAEAFNEIIVSSQLANAIQVAAPRSVTFRPLAVANPNP